MLRINFLLFLIVIFFSVMVIQQRHYSRQLFSELESLKGDRDSLNIEWGKLLLEEGAWSQHQRIEYLARTQLDMTTPSPDQIEVSIGKNRVQ